MDQFSCHGFHEELPKGKSSGQLHITAIGFEYRIANKQGQIPFEGTELVLGGASNRLVFIKHPSVSDWSIYTSDLAILNHSAIKNHPTLKKHSRKVKNSRQFAWVIVALVAFLIVAAPTYVVFNMDVLAKSVVSQIPVEWETRLAETSMAQMQINQEFYDREETDQLLKPLVNPLLDALSSTPYDYQFYIVNDASLNAFALPGGHVVIHTGLILKADTAEELLGVLGHEISHVTEQHGLRNVVSSAGVYLVLSALIGDVNGLMATVAGAAPLLLNMSYSRKFETEADTKGFELLVSANVDPRGFARFFEKMKQEEEERMVKLEDDKAREALEFAMKYISSHPGTEDRMAHINKMSESSQGPYMDLQSEFEQLKQVITGYVTESDTDIPSINSPVEEQADAN